MLRGSFDMRGSTYIVETDFKPTQTHYWMPIKEQLHIIIP